MSVLETMVAAVILSAGVLGVFVMVEVADNVNKTNRGRETANALARELLETARSTPFQDIGVANWMNTTMTNLEGRTGAVQSPSTHAVTTTVTRRDVAYAVSVDTCSVDDAKDGYGPHSGSINWCSDSLNTTGTDAKAEDLKRVAVTLTWSENAKNYSIYQTATFSSTGQVVGPTVSTLQIKTPAVADPTAPVITSGSNATFEAVASGAADMKFSVDGVEQTSGVSGGNGTWGFNWNITNLKDGVYQIGATAVDSLGTRGAPMILQVKLARGVPVGATNVTGGYNDVFSSGSTTRVVELGWDASPEGNVTGYEVLKGATTVCAASLNLECMDMSPASSGSTVYTVRTLYTDAAGAQGSVSTTYSVTAPTGGGTLPNTYGIVNTSNNATPTMCWNGGTPPGARDLVSNYPTSGGTNSTFGSSLALIACLPPFQNPVSMAAGTVTGRMYFTNTSTNRTCSLAAARLYIDATVVAGPVNVNPAIGPNTLTPVLRTFTFAVSARTFPAGSQLVWNQHTGSNDNNCTGVRLNFGSGTYQSTVTLPALSSTGGTALTKPSAPTGLTVTANPDGTRTVTWTPPATSTPAVEFFRIYRDGQNYTNRIDTLGAVGTGVHTWVDADTNGTSHSYRVTSAAATMTESDQLGPVSG